MSKAFKVGEIAGVVIRDLRKFSDSRGWLAELFATIIWNLSFTRRWHTSHLRIRA